MAALFCTAANLRSSDVLPMPASPEISATHPPTAWDAIEQGAQLFDIRLTLKQLHSRLP